VYCGINNYFNILVRSLRLYSTLDLHHMQTTTNVNV